MYYGILVDDPFLLLLMVESGGRGGVGWGWRVGGKRGPFQFKGAVNLINLNILDKPVKTL